MHKNYHPHRVYKYGKKCFNPANPLHTGNCYDNVQYFFKIFLNSSENFEEMFSSIWCIVIYVTGSICVLSVSKGLGVSNLPSDITAYLQKEYNTHTTIVEQVTLLWNKLFYHYVKRRSCHEKSFYIGSHVFKILSWF